MSTQVRFIVVVLVGLHKVQGVELSRLVFSPWQAEHENTRRAVSEGDELPASIPHACSLHAFFSSNYIPLGLHTTVFGCRVSEYILLSRF